MLTARGELCRGLQEAKGPQGGPQTSPSIRTALCEVGSAPRASGAAGAQAVVVTHGTPRALFSFISRGILPAFSLFKAASPAPKRFGDEFLHRAPPSLCGRCPKPRPAPLSPGVPGTLPKSLDYFYCLHLPLRALPAVSAGVFIAALCSQADVRSILPLADHYLSLQASLCCPGHFHLQLLLLLLLLSGTKFPPQTPPRCLQAAPE